MAIQIPFGKDFLVITFSFRDKGHRWMSLEAFNCLLFQTSSNCVFFRKVMLTFPLWKLGVIIFSQLIEKRRGEWELKMEQGIWTTHYMVSDSEMVAKRAAIGVIVATINAGGTTITERKTMRVPMARKTWTLTGILQQRRKRRGRAGNTWSSRVNLEVRTRSLEKRSFGPSRKWKMLTKLCHLIIMRQIILI